MKKFTKLLCTLALLFGVVGGVKAEKKALSFETPEYCAATWNATTSTLTWGSGGWNSGWTFMAAKDISGDLSSWETLHLNAKNFTNASSEELKIVFKSGGQEGPTKEFTESPNENGDITMDLTKVDWGDCDITSIFDLTIYGGARIDGTQDASVVITDAYLERPDIEIPTIEDNTSWTGSEVAAGNFVLYNVGSGQFFLSGNNWGSRASITSNGSAGSGRTITIESVGDNWKLRTDQNGSGFGVEVLNATDLYNDQSRDKNSTWVFEQVAIGNGPVYTIKSADNHNGGSGYYMTANNSNTIVNPSKESPTAYAQWKLLDAAKVPLIDAMNRYNNIKSAALAISAEVDITDADAAFDAATSQEAIDAAIATLRAAFLAKLPNVTVPTEPGYIDVTTVMVDNASVSLNTNYWTIENLSSTGGSAGVCNYGECEFYQRNFKFYQTLALIPGTWEFGVTGFHRAGNHNTHFYAGTADKILIPGVSSDVVNSMAGAKTYFDEGNGKVDLKFLIESAQDVEIGIDNQDTETDKWTIFRDFTLKYYGAPDYSVYDDRLAELADEAATYSSKIPASAYTVLNNVVTENKKGYTKKADYIAAINTIENAITNAKAIQTTYNAFSASLSVRAKAVTTSNLEQLATADKTTLEGVITDADEALEDCATLEDLNAAITLQNANLWTAIGVAINTIELAGNETLDLTYLLTNPDVTGMGNGKKDGWYTDQAQPVQNSQAMTTNNSVANSEDNTKYAMYEYWSNTTEATNGFTVYQLVTLPEGTYQMDALCFAGYGGGAQYSSAETKNITFSANDVDGTKITTTTLEPATLEFVHKTAGEVKIGLKAHEGNTSNWMGIGYVQFYKKATNDSKYAITTTATNATVAVTVGGEAASEAMALDGVNVAVNIEEGYIITEVAASYTENEEVKQIELTNIGGGSYTFQMPAFDVNINVVAVVNKTELAAAITAATDAAITEDNVPNALYTPFSSALTSATTVNGKADATVAEVADATSALTAATEAAIAAQPSYAKYNTLKAQAEALVAVSNNNSEANSELATAINNQNTAVESATTTAAIIESATSTLKTAMVTYVGVAEPTNDECFDLTFMIVNPHFTEGNADNPTGWDVNYPAAPEGQWGGAKELRLSTHNFEAYHKQFTLSQTIADLKKGTYKVTLQGFARHDDANVTDKTSLFCGSGSQTIKDINSEYSTTSFYNNTKTDLGDTNYDSQSTLGETTIYRPNGMTGAYYWFLEENSDTNQPFYTSEVPTLMPNDGDLTIGFKCETWSDWVIWDNFHLYYYGSAIAVTIDENVTNSSYTEDIENANITLNRTFSENKDNWNTISLPFDLTDAETKVAFGDDVKVATYSETAYGTNSTVAFNIAADAAITANTPVLLKTSTTETSFTFNGKTIKAGEAKVEGTNFDFVGTYDASTTIAEGDYFISANLLYKSKGATTIKGTRAYLKAKSADVKAINFYIGGIETAISEINDDANVKGTIYNLAGQRVNKAQKGIFIVNGKKVVVK